MVRNKLSLLSPGKYVSEWLQRPARSGAVWCGAGAARPAAAAGGDLAQQPALRERLVQRNEMVVHPKVHRWVCCRQGALKAPAQAPANSTGLVEPLYKEV